MTWKSFRQNYRVRDLRTYKLKQPFQIENTMGGHFGVYNDGFGWYIYAFTTHILPENIKDLKKDLKEKEKLLKEVLQYYGES